MQHHMASLKQAVALCRHKTVFLYKISTQYSYSYIRPCSFSKARHHAYLIRPRHCPPSSTRHWYATQDIAPTHKRAVLLSNTRHWSCSKHHIVFSQTKNCPYSTTLHCVEGNQIGTPTRHRARVHQWHMGNSVLHLPPTRGPASIRHPRLQSKGLVCAFGLDRQREP